MYFLQIFKNYRLFEFLILGIISGMQLSIIVTIIITWLKESNVPIEIVTTFVFAKISYSLKFILAPIIDYFNLPILIKFGKRKSWMLFCSIINIIILLLISFINPINNLTSLYFLMLIFGLSSAIFDINVAGFRIEQANTQVLGLATANASSGFNIGMLTITTSIFYYVDITKNWNIAFLLIAASFVIALVFITTIKESTVEEFKNISLIKNTFVKDYIVLPLKDFLIKNYAYQILLAIIFFKISEAFITVIYNPFYLDCGYSKTQIATITSLYGFPIVIFGTYISAFVIHKFGNIKALMFAAFIQITVKLSFLWLFYQSINIKNLLIAVTFENLSAGIGSTALIAYLASLCNKKYSATQYAMLSSISSLCSTVIAMLTGYMIKTLYWNMYFISAILLSLPSIIFFTYLYKKTHTC